MWVDGFSHLFSTRYFKPGRNQGVEFCRERRKLDALHNFFCIILPKILFFYILHNGICIILCKISEKNFKFLLEGLTYSKFVLFCIMVTCIIIHAFLHKS